MLLFSIYLVVVIALPIALSAVIGFRTLPRGAACPNCAQGTLLLLSFPLSAGRRLRADFSLQRRWCPACEWDGYARRHESLPATNCGETRTGRAQVRLRLLELAGKPWQVWLESWQEAGQWQGRLLFIGPSGRQWCDPSAAFNGATFDDVRDQALSLSDPSLACRLREMISG